MLKILVKSFCLLVLTFPNLNAQAAPQKGAIGSPTAAEGGGDDDPPTLPLSWVCPDMVGPTADGAYNFHSRKVHQQNNPERFGNEDIDGAIWIKDCYRMYIHGPANVRDKPNDASYG